MEVEFPDWRADVLAGLDLLAADPPEHFVNGSDQRWPDLRNAIHWVVDDTWWDQRSPEESIGKILRNQDEAEAVAAVVSAVSDVARRQRSVRDVDWFADPGWPVVRESAQRAAAVLRA